MLKISCRIINWLEMRNESPESGSAHLRAVGVGVLGSGGLLAILLKACAAGPHPIH